MCKNAGSSFIGRSGSQVVVYIEVFRILNESGDLVVVQLSNQLVVAIESLSVAIIHRLTFNTPNRIVAHVRNSLLLEILAEIEEIVTAGSLILSAETNAVDNPNGLLLARAEAKSQNCAAQNCKKSGFFHNCLCFKKLIIAPQMSIYFCTSTKSACKGNAFF